MSVSGKLTETFSKGNPNSSPTICASEVNAPCPMSTLLVRRIAEPSALSRTLADEVVGVVVLLIVTASPLPRTRLLRGCAADCSSFPFQPMVAAACFTQSVMPTETIVSPVTKRHPLDEVFQAQFQRIRSQAPRDVVHLGFVGPTDMGHADAAKRAGGRQIGINGVGRQIRLGML